MKKNPRSGYRWTPVNEIKTQRMIEKYRVKAALLQEWESFPDHIQAANKLYIQRLRDGVRRLKGYLVHRAEDIEL